MPNAITPAFVLFLCLGACICLKASKYHIISIVAIIQGTVYPADRSGGSTGLLSDIQICLLIPQHLSHLEPL